MFGRKWRARSPENVVEELKLLRYKYKVREIEFLDDIFTLNKERAKEICNLIVKEKLDISWSCSSRVDTIDYELARELKKAGCHTVYVGVECGTQKSLDFINKKITVKQAIKAVKALKRAGLKVLASFILGIPGETETDIKKTISLARHLDPDFVQFTILTPYPGTPLFDIAREKGWLRSLDWREYNVLNPVMEIPGLSPKKLKRLLNYAYIYFYLRPKYMIKVIKERNIFLLIDIFKGAINLIKGRILS